MDAYLHTKLGAKILKYLPPECVPHDLAVRAALLERCTRAARNPCPRAAYNPAPTLGAP